MVARHHVYSTFIASNFGTKFFKPSRGCLILGRNSTECYISGNQNCIYVAEFLYLLNGMINQFCTKIELGIPIIMA